MRTASWGIGTGWGWDGSPCSADNHQDGVESEAEGSHSSSSDHTPSPLVEVTCLDWRAPQECPALQPAEPPFDVVVSAARAPITLEPPVTLVHVVSRCWEPSFQCAQIPFHSWMCLAYNKNPDNNNNNILNQSFHKLSHPFPLPSPVLYLGIPCALVKLME